MCRDGERKPHTKYCDQYYFCVRGQYDHRKCVYPDRWSIDHEQCERLQSVSCGERIPKNHPCKCHILNFILENVNVHGRVFITHTRTHAHTPHTHTHARTPHTRTHARARTHARTHTRNVMYTTFEVNRVHINHVIFLEILMAIIRRCIHRCISSTGDREVTTRIGWKMVDCIPQKTSC